MKNQNFNKQQKKVARIGKAEKTYNAVQKMKQRSAALLTVKTAKVA